MRGPLSYVGGKNRIASAIIAQLPVHTTYVEPFAGGAQVFFRKEPSKVEVLNDLDGELVNFYRVCQSHHTELVRYMRFMITSREWFQTLQKTPPESLTDIQRASRYFYLQKSAYGGRVDRQNYAIHIMQPPNFTTERLSGVIEETHKRLARVQIEKLPYEKILKRYDRKNTLFYLDPPYYGVNLYHYTFKHEDFKQLAERLSGLVGNFVLSINDTPEIREMFSHFNISEIPISYTIQRKAGKRFCELLIKNH
jgi:DNA adenine methylase